jgi:hypothetical protein
MDFRSGFRKEKVLKVGQLERSKVDHFYTIVDTAHPGGAKEPSPQVYVTNFSAGGVTFSTSGLDGSP